MAEACMNDFKDTKPNPRYAKNPQQDLAIWRTMLIMMLEVLIRKLLRYFVSEESRGSRPWTEKLCSVRYSTTFESCFKKPKGFWEIIMPSLEAWIMGHLIRSCCYELACHEGIESWFGKFDQPGMSDLNSLSGLRKDSWHKAPTSDSHLIQIDFNEYWWSDWQSILVASKKGLPRSNEGMLAGIYLLFKADRWLITLCMDFVSIELKLMTAQELRRPVPFNRAWQGSWLTGASSSICWWQLTDSLISIRQLVKLSWRHQPYAA